MEDIRKEIWEQSATGGLELATFTEIENVFVHTLQFAEKISKEIYIGVQLNIKECVKSLMKLFS